MTQPAKTLHSYRCTCGKLLFKGLLLDSTVQIKCKKCGELLVIQGESSKITRHDRYAFILNRRGEVVTASDNIHKLFGHDLSSLLSLSLDDVSPTIASRDALQSSLGQMWSLHHKERYFFKSKTVYRHTSGGFVPGVTQSKFVITPEDTYLLNVFYANATLDDAPAEPEFLQLREYPFFLRVNCDGIFTYAHTDRQRPYSRTHNEIVGQSYTAFMDESASVRRDFALQLRQNKPFGLMGKRYERGNGKIIMMDAYFAPNLDEAGDIIDYSVYIFNDELLKGYEDHLAQSPKT